VSAATMNNAKTSSLGLLTLILVLQMPIQTTTALSKPSSIL